MAIDLVGDGESAVVEAAPPVSRPWQKGQKRGATKGKGNAAAGAAGKKREVALPKRIRDIRRLLKKDTLTADVRLSQVSLPNVCARSCQAEMRKCVFIF
jgi:hypothetical protein